MCSLTSRKNVIYMSVKPDLSRYYFIISRIKYVKNFGSYLTSTFSIHTVYITKDIRIKKQRWSLWNWHVSRTGKKKCIRNI
jgi:hypothetical protein